MMILGTAAIDFVVRDTGDSEPMRNYFSYLILVLFQRHISC